VAAPIKNTVGEGFSVEEQVVGALAMHLLSGVPWPGAKGFTIVALECQKRADGWFFDDVVVHVEQGGITRSIGCSVKSFPVFGPQGAPKDLVMALWGQWRATAPRAFDADRDWLALISAQHTPEVREVWFGLTDEAHVTDPVIYAARFMNGTEPSSSRRESFASLLQAEAGGTADEAARLLSRLYLVEHDFQHTSSQTSAQYIALAQQALEDAARDRAADLWQAVCTVVAPIRRKGGRITLTELLADLVPRFPLKHHPDYAADLISINTESRARVATLPVKLGHVLGFERPELATAIAKRIHERRCTVLVGASGNGKTVLARNWVAKHPGPICWIRASDLAQPGGLRAVFKLKREFSQLFPHSSQSGRIVLDGLDKCFDDVAFDEAARVLLATNDAVALVRWEVLITCCPEDWERVHRHLLRRGVALTGENVTIPRFTPQELKEACTHLPSLTGLAQRPHLRAILLWPKVLDLVATYGQGASSGAQWASESDFAQWFWKSILSRDQLASPRDRVARKLGVQLGDRMCSTISLDAFDAAEIPLLSDLTREGHLDIDQNRNTVRFSHELLADWARARELQVQGTAVATFLAARLSSPLWHRALRFHALSRLEQSADAKAWLSLFEQFRGNATVDELAQNLLLEAAIFALDSAAILERLWPTLEANDGALLKRFLRQFLWVGTIPDRYALQFYKDQTPEQELELEALYRVPWVPYWFGVIRFLGQHVEQVAALAPEESAEVCLHWLSLCRALSHGMEAAAALAVAVARGAMRGLSGRHRGSYREASPKEKAYRALMAAAPVAPEPVTDLVLKLAGRRLPAEGETEPEKFPRPKAIPDRGEQKPWPEGPITRASGAFRRALLDGQYASPLFHALPAVSVEAMFGVLLDLPYANDSFEDFGVRFQLDEHGFNTSSHLPRSAWWTNGSFVAFLNANPKVALAAIIRLVNFATDRAGELPEGARPRLVVPVRVGNQINLWRGHPHSFVWHKGHVFGPRAVGCALLSLEKWFYLQLEAKQSIEGYLTTIVAESRSIALAGVLVEVGKKNPELFIGPLRPIVEALEFSWIERQLRAGSEGGYMGASFDMLGGEAKVAHDWATMPHRQEGLNELVVRHFLTDPRWGTMIDEMRPRWSARLAAKDDPAPEFFASTVSQFDKTNWKMEHMDAKTLVTYTPPADLPQPSAEEIAQQERTRLLLFIPIECHRMLQREIDSPEAKLVEWWVLIPTIEVQQVPEEQRDYRNTADALLGIVAVAVVLHRTWLAADPAREELAERLLFETGFKRRRYLASLDGIIGYKWDNFAAWAMTTLWCESPDDPVLRQGVAGLAMWQRYEVVERVMLVAAAQREQLGSHFDMLLAHAIRYAPLRDQLETDRAWQKQTFDHTAALTALFETFLARKTEPLPAEWKTIATPKPPGHYRQSGGVDMMQLHAALTWAADLKQARDTAERTAWTRMHLQALACGLARLERLAGLLAEKGEDYQLVEERAAYRGEEDLLKRLGEMVARMAPGEDHQTLWEPILALGAHGNQWINTFLSAWFLDAGAHDQVKPAMAEQWNAMLRFASASPAWVSEEHRWRAGRDLWEELLGIRSFGWNYWDERMIGIVQAVREFHEGWARKHATSPYDTKHYLIFLGHKGARGTRVGGLLIYHQPAIMADSHYWAEEDIQNGFARVLKLALDENWGELAANRAARDAFLAIALKLASQQHPLGSELLAFATQRFAALG
jgi:hypothetical protein